MEFILEFLGELFFEIFGEGFLALRSAFIPKSLSPKTQKRLGVVFLVLSIVLFLGLLAGVFLLVDTRGNSVWGWLLIALAAIYVIAGIVLNLMIHFKNR